MIIFQCLFVVNRTCVVKLVKMESDSALHAEIADGGEMSPLAENQQESETLPEISDNNVTTDDSEAVPALDDAGFYYNFFLFLFI